MRVFIERKSKGLLLQQFSSVSEIFSLSYFHKKQLPFLTKVSIEQVFILMV